MSLTLNDLQKLQEDTESTIGVEKTYGGGFVVNRRIHHASSILIGCLSALCVGLLCVNIILALILSRQQLDQRERNMEEKAKTLILEVNAISERLSPEGPLSGDIQKILGAVRKLEEGIKISNIKLSSGIQRILEDLGNGTDDVQRKNKPIDPLCSAGWTRHGHSCYVLSSKNQSWNDAKKDCEDLNAKLVVIDDEVEMEFLRTFVKVDELWIGLSDVSGRWQWVDGTPLNRTPTFWEENQPDDWEDHGLGGGEDCVELRNKDKWNDHHCSLSFEYVCEEELF